MTDEVIRINVGGCLYSTTKHTLVRGPNSQLSCLVRGEDTLPDGIIRLDDGSFFIDRDGDLFTHILHYLRTEKLSLPEGFRDMARLKDEAEFYQLEGLAERCQPSPPLFSSLRPKLSNGGSYNSGETGIYF